MHSYNSNTIMHYELYRNSAAIFMHTSRPWREAAESKLGHAEALGQKQLSVKREMANNL